MRRNRRNAVQPARLLPVSFTVSLVCCVCLRAQVRRFGPHMASFTLFQFICLRPIPESSSSLYDVRSPDSIRDQFQIRYVILAISGLFSQHSMAVSAEPYHNPGAPWARAQVRGVTPRALAPGVGVQRHRSRHLSWDRDRNVPGCEGLDHRTWWD